MKKIFKNVVFDEIKNTLEKFTNKNLYQCPNCDCIDEWDDTYYNPEDSTYTCKKCMHTFNENELLEVTLLDYITDLFITYKGDKDNGQY